MAAAIGSASPASYTCSASASIVVVDAFVVVPWLVDGPCRTSCTTVVD